MAPWQGHEAPWSEWSDCQHGSSEATHPRFLSAGISEAVQNGVQRSKIVRPFETHHKDISQSSKRLFPPLSGVSSLTTTCTAWEGCTACPAHMKMRRQSRGAARAPPEAGTDPASGDC